MGKLKQIWQRQSRQLGLEHLPCAEMLRELGLVSLELGPLGEKGVLGGPTLAPQYLGEAFEKIELGSAQWCMMG